MQHLMHQLKYKGNKELGKQLGRIMGYDLQQTSRFKTVIILFLSLYSLPKKKEEVITRQQFYAKESLR